jgi:hypothetical protein
MNKFDLDFLINHVENCVKMADENNSRLIGDILQMEGMSGKKTRHLYNNICNLDNANYLEVGPWKGSSFVSALYNNNINSIAIDNWSEFSGPKNEFLNNVGRLCPNNRFSFIEKNSFEVTDEEIFSFYDSVDVYLYDGCHKYESHKQGITYFEKFLSKYSIILVDDWRNDGNWIQVQNGTYDGFKESNLKIHHKIERITFQESTGPAEYWNGFGLFVCEKL